MYGFLHYVEGDSFLHRMNPVAKLSCAILLCVACFCCNNLAALCVLAALGFAFAKLCGMLRQALHLARAVLAFSALLAVIQVLSTPVGTPLVSLPWGFIGTGSLLAAACTMVRLVAAAIPLFVALSVTNLTDLTNSLVKSAHVPYKYAFAFTSTIRFIPVFASDMSSIMEAQTARGVQFDTAGFAKKIQLAAPLCIPLLISSVRKVNSTAIAAEVRGFNLRTSASGFRSYPFAARDVAAISLCTLLLAGCIALSVLM